jgi:preflagellin peptidase FlaK
VSLATVPDLLRLVLVPVLGWAAIRDVRTRRVSNRIWPPLAGLAVVLLVWDGLAALGDPAPFAFRLFAIRVTVSLGLVIPLAYLFWRMGGFGGADAKAFMVVAVLFPTYPTYQLAGTTLPLQHTTLGVFSLTVLTNTVLVGALYPLALLVRNALAGRVSKAMVVGLPVRWEDVETTHGRLLETPSGFTRGGLDLDALRMYLAWRGVTLADLRADAEGLRDPTTLPEEPNSPGDGAVATDGGEMATNGDPWGAEAFLDSIEGSAYGTTPGQLREGLDLLVTEDEVWVSPGIPFIVPLFVGLLVALVYGDLLFAAMGAIGLV